MAAEDSGTSFASMFVGSLGFTISTLCILGFFVSNFAIDYIDNRIEEDCESEKGQVGQLVGADEGQCDEGSKNKLELLPGYDKAMSDGDVVIIMKNLKAICLGNDDVGKAALSVKSLNNFTNPKVTNPHYF